MAFPKELLTLSKLISAHGIEEVIICPGSRNAPLIVSFERNKELKTYSLVDERSAAFFAIGRAIITKKPIAICCTSGSAGLNMAPAIAEAFHQEIPIVVLTADRPAEWIDQWDGQTIRQENFLATVVKKSYNFPVSNPANPNTSWFQERLLNEALIQLVSNKKGPIHINIPIIEPFYPAKGEEFEFPEKIKKVQFLNFKKTNSLFLQEFFKSQKFADKKILISIGQMDDTESILPILENLQNKGVVCVGDTTSNGANHVIQNHDLVLANESNWSKLSPHIVIHIGKSHVSKRIKLFLRAQKHASTWWINEGENDQIVDNFQNLSQIFNCKTFEFLNELNTNLSNSKYQNSFSSTWKELSNIVSKKQMDFLNKSQETWSELIAVNSILKYISQRPSSLFLGNSLSVRYSNWLPFQTTSEHFIYCNRGTSGIEGSLSTYVGANVENTNLSYLMIGDLSFHYDKNGLWNHYLNPNLRIIVLNNSGGGIFRNLEGAKDLPELESLISTRQTNSAQNTANDAGLHYLAVHSNAELHENLVKLSSKSNSGMILEVFTNPDTNANVLAEYMNLFKS